MHTPAQFQRLPQDRKAVPLSQPTATEADLRRWWTQLRDPQLDALEQRALASNLTLQITRLRVREAREQELIARSAYYPSVALSGNAAHLYFRSNPFAGLGGGQSNNEQTGSTTANLYALGFDASWETDLFGGTRRNVEAARATRQAADWQLADAQVTLTAELANAYLLLRSIQARLAILQESIGRQQEELTITAARARFGFVTELDVNQQRTQLAATQAQLPSLEAQEAAAVHALSVLLGEEPEQLLEELSRRAPLPTVPATLPVGIPADLLRRRPDVRQAERELAAANAQIGVAVANLFPKLNLLALPTLAATTPGDLFSTKGLSTISAAAITWPLFEGEQLRATVRIRKEQRQEAYLSYQQTVLVALQDAEDALSRYAAEQRRLQSLRESEKAARAALHIAEEQYRAGLVPFINVLNAQAALLSAQDQVAQSEQALAQNLVSVYKALGGGWSPETTLPEVPEVRTMHAR